MSFRLQKISFLLSILIFSNMSLADESTSSLTCRKYLDGWQIFNHLEQPLADGYFKPKQSCLDALNQTYNGYLCAAHNGGAAVIDIRSGKRAGEGYWEKLSDCLNVIKNSRGDLICGSQSGGSIVFHRSFGALGKGAFERYVTCQNSIEYAIKGIVCAPYAGGAAMIDLNTGKQLGGWFWKQVSDCHYASQAVENNRACLPETNQIRLTNLRTGKVEGVFKNLDQCIAEL